MQLLDLSGVVLAVAELRDYLYDGLNVLEKSKLFQHLIMERKRGEPVEKWLTPGLLVVVPGDKVLQNQELSKFFVAAHDRALTGLGLKSFSDQFVPRAESLLDMFGKGQKLDDVQRAVAVGPPLCQEVVEVVDALFQLLKLRQVEEDQMAQKIFAHLGDPSIGYFANREELLNPVSGLKQLKITPLYYFPGVHNAAKRVAEQLLSSELEHASATSCILQVLARATGMAAITTFFEEARVTMENQQASGTEREQRELERVAKVACEQRKREVERLCRGEGHQWQMEQGQGRGQGQQQSEIVPVLKQWSERLRQFKADTLDLVKQQIGDAAAEKLQPVLDRCTARRGMVSCTGRPKELVG